MRNYQIALPYLNTVPQHSELAQLASCTYSGFMASKHGNSTNATISRHFDCDPDDVWDRLTSGPGFEHWMGLGSTIDATPDGELIAADPESGVPKIGRVLRAEPGRLLHWVWRPLGVDPTPADGTTEVLIEIEPAAEEDDGTVLTVTEGPSTIDVPAACTAQAAAGSAFGCLSHAVAF